MKRLSVFGLVVLVLAGIVAIPGPAVADAQTVNVTSPAEGNDTFTETQFIVTVYENGSARWTQRYNQPLTNETEIRRFRAYADRFESKETAAYSDFKQRATELTEEGSNATGRDMDAQGFTRNARVVSQPTATGVVEMSFMWTNFTATENGRVVIGDAFENGLYLSSGMSLEIRAGPNLDIDWTAVEPTPDASSNGSGNASDSLTYFGETQFASGHPRVVFTSEDALGASGSSSFGAPMLWIAGVFVLVTVLGAVVWRSGAPTFGTADNEGESVTMTEADDESDTDTESTAETSEATTPPEPAVTDAALRSDEDRIIALLEANDGRMQQATIVEETGWSKSKVSMLLSEMAEEGRVSKLRVGRENIVSLAGHEPEAAGSPFEDG